MVLHNTSSWPVKGGSEMPSNCCCFRSHSISSAQSSAEKLIISQFCLIPCSCFKKKRMLEMRSRWCLVLVKPTPEETCLGPLVIYELHHPFVWLPIQRWKMIFKASIHVDKSPGCWERDLLKSCDAMRDILDCSYFIFCAMWWVATATFWKRSHPSGSIHLPWRTYPDGPMEEAGSLMI